MWEVKSASSNGDRLSQLLKDGFEPFSATVVRSSVDSFGTQETIWLRREVSPEPEF